MELNLRELLRLENRTKQNVLLDKFFSAEIEPLIKKTVRVKFRSISAAVQDEEDICSEASLRLWKQMQKWIRTPEAMDVGDLPAYVAAITLNCCKEYLRNRYPRRWHLRNRLRYLFTHSDPLVIWKSDTGEWLCGFKNWQGKQPIKHEQLKPLTDISRSIGKNLSRLVTFVLQTADAPLTLDGLLSTVIEVPGIREEFQDIQLDQKREINDLADPKPNMKYEIEKKTYLKRLWSEICGLPVNQRIALLLNLRDREGRDAIMSLPATGTASLREIANAMNMPATELAALWNDLPLDDARIAQRLQLSRQQVINLRKSARERLQYRMRRLSDVI